MPSRPIPPRARQAAIAVALFVVAFVWLSLRPSAPLQEDTSRDLAFARELIDGAVAYRHGAWASFAALRQGTSWIDLLALAQLLGLGVVGIERLLGALLAASVALAYLGFAWMLPRGEERSEIAAIVGALIVLAALPLACEMPILWQPTLLPVVVVLGHLSLWRLLRDGELIDALALAILWALALDIHVVSIAVVLLAVAAVPLASKQPWLATPLALVCAVGTLVLSSWDAVWDNVAILAEHGWLMPALIVGVLALIAGALGRRRFGALDWPTRLRVGLGLELALLAALMLASLSDATPQLTGRYLSPFLPAVALALAVLSRRARSPWVSLVLAVCLVLGSFTQLRPKPARVLPIHPEWRIAEFEGVATELRTRELSWSELVARLQGPSMPLVLGHLSAFVEPGVADPPRPDAGLLLLALTSSQLEEVLAELPRDVWHTSIDDDLHALLVDTPARTDRLGTQLCRDGQDCTEVVLAVTNRVYQGHVSAWIDGELADAWLERDAPVQEIQWKFPVARGPATTLLLTGTLPEHCAWFFVAAEGFELSTQLPTHVLELPEQAEGTLLVARRLDPDEWACNEHGVMPPAIIETQPQWTRLRELLAPPW